MSYVMQFNRPGGPDSLEQSIAEVVKPGPGEVRLRQEAVGLNFIDVYHRSGLYPLPLPGIPGVEGAGVVEAVGGGVDPALVGRRVVYAGLPGAYAQVRIIPAWRAVPLPDDIATDTAGSTLLRGLTAHMLLTRVYPVTAGSTLLIHAAAGGLGSILTRWGKYLGATVIGTVSLPDKEVIARENGADHVIVGRDSDIASQVAECTEGKGVHFAIDGIGGDMLARTLACVRPFGIVASVGQAGGAPPPISLDALGPVRSLSLARPSVMRYSADELVYSQAVRAVLGMMKAGIFAGIQKRYGLSDAAIAHQDLEAGHITGSAVLIP